MLTLALPLATTGVDLGVETGVDTACMFTSQIVSIKHCNFNANIYFTPIIIEIIS